MTLHINDILTWLDYKIVDGTEFLWSCYGEHARYLHFEKRLSSSLLEWYVSVVFDTRVTSKKGIVYEVSIEYRKNDDYQSFKWHNPTYYKMYLKECKKRKIKHDIAYDDVKYISIDNAKILKKYLKELCKNNMIPN